MHLFARQTGWMQVLPGGHKSTVQQHSACFGPLPVLAAANTSTAADKTALPAQQQVSKEAATPLTSGTASPRRRRRTTTRLNEDAARESAAKSSKASKNPSMPKYELFQQPSAVASPARNAVTLPPAALSDPNEALHRRTRRVTRRGAPANSSSSEQQATVPAEFEPYAQSFQQVAQQLAAKQQQGASSADARASAAAPAEAAWNISSSRARWNNKQQQSNKQRKTGKALELFGIATDSSTTSGSKTSHATAMTATQVNVHAPDTLAQQPSQSRLAAQRLASLLMQQQQQRKLQQQQEAEPDPQQQDLQQHNSSKQRPARIVSPSMPQQGTTRLYMPAPSVNDTSSAADRQPLRLLSVRQQQQMRQEARQQAIQKLRQKAVQDYQATLDQTLNWQGSGQYTYHPAAPRFLPVALQRSWIPSSASSSGTSSSGEDQSPAAAAAAQLSQSDLAAVKAINQVITKQLGTTATLPDRAYKGERGLYIASLSPQAIADRLRRWSSCCGAAYTAQLIKREPCLLGLEPQTLLKTLEALHKTLQLPTQACVEFVSKNVVVVGLDSDELKARVQGLIDAVGLGWEDAVELAQKQPQLLMVHPSHIKGQMAALAKLLPEAAPKLPQTVKRSPFLILKSPRAIARSIQELADSLGLSTWATARLVAGQPSILSSNCDQLQNRLQRLQHLTSVSRRWQRELQALSPTLLARCLACSDATVERLALLTDVGAAGASRLPPVHLVLTMPENYFQEMLADLAERNLKRLEEPEAAEAEELPAVGESRLHEPLAVTTGAVGAGVWHAETAGSVASRSRQSVAGTSELGSSRKGNSSSVPSVQTAVGRQLLQRLGLGGTQQNGSIHLATRAASKNAAIARSDDGTGPYADAGGISDKAVREGVLGGDAAWRSTLAGLKDALQQSVADLAGGRNKKSSKSSKSKTPGKA